MNKSNQIIVGLIAVVLIGGSLGFATGAFSEPKNEPKTEVKKEIMEKTEDKMTKKEGETMEKKDGEVMKKDEVMEKKDGDVMKKDETKTISEGSYKTYSKDIIANADSSPTVIFFHASWCPTCKAADKDINANIDTLKKSGVTILKADYDTSTDLKKQYGVTSQSTFVKVDSTGKEIKKGQGFTTLGAITDFAI
jgi:thiol-disulfide isomerase/thioredoxin